LLLSPLYVNKTICTIGSADKATPIFEKVLVIAGATTHVFLNSTMSGFPEATSGRFAEF
jgi:hypothetical protein